MDSNGPEARAIAESVRALLAERGITIEQASERTDIEYRTMRRRLSGQGKAFDIKELAQIARLLDVSITALITFAEAVAS